MCTDWLEIFTYCPADNLSIHWLGICLKWLVANRSVIAEICACIMTFGIRVQGLIENLCRMAYTEVLYNAENRVYCSYSFGIVCDKSPNAV
jgi:hypothetical protein